MRMTYWSLGSPESWRIRRTVVCGLLIEIRPHCAQSMGQKGVFGRWCIREQGSVRPLLCSAFYRFAICYRRCRMAYRQQNRTGIYRKCQSDWRFLIWNGKGRLIKRPGTWVKSRFFIINAALVETGEKMMLFFHFFLGSTIEVMQHFSYVLYLIDTYWRCGALE